MIAKAWRRRYRPPRAVLRWHVDRTIIGCRPRRGGGPGAAAPARAHTAGSWADRVV